MKKQLSAFFLCGLMVLLAACSPRVISNAEGRRGVVRDAIYSLEPRQNGAYVMWLRFENEGVYCINDETLYEKAKKIMTQGTGWALIEYHTRQITELSCKNVETTENGGGTHTIYVVNSITESENQQ